MLRKHKPTKPNLNTVYQVSLYVWLGYILGIFPYIHATQRTITMQRTQVIKIHQKLEINPNNQLM